MKQVIKIRIAKEILILFGSFIVIGLVWLVTLTINGITRNKIESLKTEINFLTRNNDSIQSTFPKSKTLDDLLIGNVPKTFYLETGDRDEYGIPIRRLIKYDELEILGNSFEKDIQTNNLRVLYHILKKSDYPFDVSQFSKYDLPMFEDFQVEILKELSGDTLNLETSKKPNLNRIFTFLVDKKYIKTESDDFVVTMVGLPYPPPHDTWTTYVNNKDQLKTLKSELIEKESRIISSDRQEDVIIWTTVLVAFIVYPLRLIFMTLAWAIKTLKKVEQE